MTTKSILLTFEEYNSLKNRKQKRKGLSDTIKPFIDLKISHIIFALRSGTILSKLESASCSVPLNSYKSLISLASTILDLYRPSKNTDLYFTTATFGENSVLFLNRF